MYRSTSAFRSSVRGLTSRSDFRRLANTVGTLRLTDAAQQGRDQDLRFVPGTSRGVGLVSYKIKPQTLDL